MPSIEPIPTLVSDLRPGDRIDLLEVGRSVIDMRWLNDPWGGRGYERNMANTHIAGVANVTTYAEGAIVEFVNYSPWYLPKNLAVNTLAPK